MQFITDIWRKMNGDHDVNKSKLITNLERKQTYYVQDIAIMTVMIILKLTRFQLR